MIEMRKVLLMSVLSLALVSQGDLARSALAAGPQDRVRETVGAVSVVLRDPKLSGSDGQVERKRRVRNIIRETFDFEDMAPESLGPQWTRLTPAEWEEFVRLFGTLFENSCTRLVLRFLGERQTNYIAESVEGKRGVVQTTLVGGKEERLSVEYRLASTHERWHVVDVLLDGVSLAANYRAQFGKVLRNSSYETLVRRMKTKAGEAE